METRKLKFNNCLELSELPWFELDDNGRTRMCADLPPIVDFHTHLGSYFLFSRPVLLNRRTPQVDHCFREDELEVDLSLYSGVNLSNTRRFGTFGDHIHTVFTRRGPNATYTVPNILEEMDRLGVQTSVVLAIDILGRPQNSMHQLDKIAGHPRLIPFCAVSALSPRMEAEVEECVAMGARGLKVHPYAQFLPPNHPKMIRLLECWSRTGYPVLFHTANNGLEPGPLRRLSDMELYEEPIMRFPKIPFILGHAGMLHFEQAANYAKAHGNAYLEIGGQPPQNIRRMIDILGPDHILFGTDWPFYPLILPMAKLLIATEDDPETRDKILSGNAYALIEKLGLNTGPVPARAAS